MDLLKRDDARLASILAGLHNGPMTRKDEKPFTPEMFMPGYEEPPPDDRLAKIKGELDLRLMQARVRKPTPEDMAVQTEIAHRRARAREAAANGATGDKINAIMCGRL